MIVEAITTLAENAACLDFDAAKEYAQGKLNENKLRADLQS